MFAILNVVAGFLASPYRTHATVRGVFDDSGSAVSLGRRRVDGSRHGLHGRRLRCVVSVSVYS